MKKMAKPDVPLQQQLGTACIQPLLFGAALTLWTVPVAARVVSRLFITAMIALLHMTAKGGGAAHFDQVEHLALLQRKPKALAIPMPVQPKNISHLHSGPIHLRQEGFLF